MKQIYNQVFCIKSRTFTVVSTQSLFLNLITMIIAVNYDYNNEETDAIAYIMLFPDTVSLYNNQTSSMLPF